MLDLAKLGTSYTLRLSNTGETSIVHVIMYSDIKEKLKMPSFISVSQFHNIHKANVKKTRALTRDANSVSWYTTIEEEFDLKDVVTMCKKEKNDIVIVEIIEPEIEESTFDDFDPEMDEWAKKFAQKKNYDDDNPWFNS